MSLTKLSIASTLAIALTLVMTSTATAAELKQSQEQSVSNSVKVTCTSGGYGESNTCTAEANGSASGKQSQEIVYRDGQPIAVHKPVDTSLDFTSAAAAVITMIGGIAGASLQIKSRA